MHCSNLAADALHIAIDDYLDRSGVAVRDKLAERAAADAQADSLECCQQGAEAGVSCTLATSERGGDPKALS